jgi:CSLREA domain-containing protein
MRSNARRTFASANNEESSMKARVILSMILFVVMAAIATGARSSTIVVTSSSSGSNDNSGCTLRDAIQAVNLRAPVGQCPAGTGPVDRIELPQSPLDFVAADDHSDNAALPALQTGRSLELYGTGQSHSAIRRSGALTCQRDGLVDAGEFRLLEVNPGAALSVSRIDFINGCADGPADPALDYSSPIARAGAILNYGTLHIDRSLLFQNAANGLGGAIFNGIDATLSISASALRSNLARVGGGALFVESDGNQASETDISASLFDGNGVYPGKTATVYGGAIRSRGNLIIVNSTFTANSATAGGGVASEALVVVSFSTFLNNEGSTRELLIADNSIAIIKSSLFGTLPFAGPGLSNCSVGATAAAYWFGTSVSADDSCAGGSNLVATSIDVNPNLGNNGGPTPTLQLYRTSAAVALADDCSDALGNPLTTDQRRWPRPHGYCDAGAYDGTYDVERIFNDGLE